MRSQVNSQIKLFERTDQTPKMSPYLSKQFPQLSSETVTKFASV